MSQVSQFTASPAPEVVRRFMVTVDSNGAETIDELGGDALVFRDVQHLIGSIVRGKLGEKVTQQLASTACMSMVEAANKRLSALRRDDVRDVLDNINSLTPHELHELSQGAYLELCIRSQRVASA